VKIAAAALLLGVFLLAGTPAAATDAGSATSAATLPTPTLLSATLSGPAPGDNLAGIITLKFDAPQPDQPLPPGGRDFNVWENGRFVGGTTFPHDVTDTIHILLCERPDGTTGNCGIWSGNPPQMIPVSGKGRFTITQSAVGFTTSAHSNGLVPTDIR
jgi:hypothetical protein